MTLKVDYLQTFFFSISLSRSGIWWTSFVRVPDQISDQHFFRRRFSAKIVLGQGSLYTFAVIIAHSLSIGHTSSNFAGVDSLSRNEGKFSEHHFCAILESCDDA